MNGKTDATGSDPAPASGTAPKPTTPAHADAKPSTAPSTTASPMASANGNGTNSAPTAAVGGAVNKKRKKDGLKPIITIEGPAPV